MRTFFSISNRVVLILLALTISPFAIAQNGTPWSQLFLDWNNTQDNGGVGVVRSIRINPSRTNSVLIGAATAGIWHTSDSGNNYTLVSGGVPEVEWVNEIVYSRANTEIVYAGTDVGVVKSLDAGLTWSYTGLRRSKPNHYSEDQWVDLANTSSDVVYATVKEGASYKLYKTTDGGVNWVEMYSSIHRIWDMRVKPNDSNTIYILEQSSATGWINFKRSTDGGVVFNTVSNGFPSNSNNNTHRARLATTPANNNVVYIAIGYNGGGVEDKISFFKSSDSGLSFTKKCCGNSNTPLEYANGPSDFTYETCHLSQLSWNFAFTVSETNEDVIACAANKLKISEDGGETWKYDRSGNVVTGAQYDNYSSNNAHTGVHGDHHGLSIIGDNIWNANDGGVYHSSDRSNTVVLDKSDGLGVQELWGYSQSFKNDIMAVGLNHNQICFRDDNVYGGWIGVNGADAMAANVNPIDDQYMYNHPWGHERVKRSLEGKTGHEHQELGIELGYITLDNLEFDPHQYYTIYGSDYGDRNETYKLAKTTDNAKTWQVIKNFEEEQKNAVSIKVSFANSNYVYAVVKPGKVIKSEDKGETWADVSPPSNLVNGKNLWRIAVSDKDPNHIWVTISENDAQNKVLHSVDGGTTWANFSAGLPNQNIYSLIYQRGSDDILYLGTSFGVYYRKNGMQQWALFGTGMPACKTPFLFINYATGKLRLGTSRGLWENDLIGRTPPKANITADRNVIDDTNQIIKYADYSVIDQNATYLWSFPNGIPSTSIEERPTVSYARATGDSFTATLTVTDSRGTSTQTLTDFISNEKTTNSAETVHSSDSERVGYEAIKAVDGDATTYWFTNWSSDSNTYPHNLVIDIGTSERIKGISYLPKQDLDSGSGRIGNFEVYVSDDPNNWGTAVASGSWPNTSELQIVTFSPKRGRYYKLSALSEVNGGNDAAIAEINAIISTDPYVYSFDSEQAGDEAFKAVDKNNGTIWHTEWTPNNPPYPHELVIDLGKTKEINGINYLPRQGQENGRIASYEIYVSDDPTNWGDTVATGTWLNTKELQTVNFASKSGRYYKLKALSEVNGNDWASVAEINCIYPTSPNVLRKSHITAQKISSSDEPFVVAYPNPIVDDLKIRNVCNYHTIMIFDANQIKLFEVKNNKKDNVKIPLGNINRSNTIIFVRLISNTKPPKTIKLIK
ncbi:hypothetical protein EI427_16800 [Flammeovirga pectinis]|uniref:PKD domain-containing protein n=1 Tax=Flammeovirga pectinis TaxID=2494373 RepID=A0A3Q9FSS8_9BACT|nr:discoidin domain-containing protein [Flammeovirga pectinis]AZQ63824.1 hypothetical protein EI427_16800 [Flammeovirga pectinis]